MGILDNLEAYLDDQLRISGSYNGSTPVSETDNEGPTPSPEARSNNQSTLTEDGDSI